MIRTTVVEHERTTSVVYNLICAWVSAGFTHLNRVCGNYRTEPSSTVKIERTPHREPIALHTLQLKPQMPFFQDES